MKVSSNRAIARIYLKNISDNIDEFKNNKKPNVKICAVVKADAYGHGSVYVAKYIQHKVDYFAVSTGDEALELIYADIKKPILILGYVFDEEIANLIKNNIEFTVYNTNIACTINDIAKNLNLIAKVHIKLDTGMSRIGFLQDDDYIKQIKKINAMENIKICGCFSHFAVADETKNTFTNLQFDTFNKMCKELEKENINLGIKHIANSSASEKNDYDLDMIRLGIGMYGYSLNDIHNDNLHLKPAMRLESVVSNIKKLKKGSTVSYSRNYTLENDEWIATVPIGYADGINRALSNQDFKVLFEDNTIGKIVGNVCMDQLMIKIEKNIDIGSKVYFFGYDNQSGYTISKFANTIIDEIVCDVHKRVKREYEF